jgi:SsrA-binding protein
MAEPRVAAENRKARHNYFIEDTVEAGIQLLGTEVKSLRAGGANIGEAYAAEQTGDFYLLNAHISEYKAGNRFNHEPMRPRKLLLHRREIDKLQAGIKRAGNTVVPLKIYFNERGYAKVLLGIARGKKQHDKRASIKDRDWKREQGRLIRARG